MFDWVTVHYVLRWDESRSHDKQRSATQRCLPLVVDVSRVDHGADAMARARPNQEELKRLNLKTEDKNVTVFDTIMARRARNGMKVCSSL
jgi:hypothetical protein